MSSENINIFKTSPKRSRLERTVAILRAMQKTSTPTLIMAQANINYTELKIYVEHMRRLSLIQVLEEKHRKRKVRRYLISEKGAELLNTFHKVEDCLGIKASD